MHVPSSGTPTCKALGKGRRLRSKDVQIKLTTAKCLVERGVANDFSAAITELADLATRSTFPELRSAARKMESKYPEAYEAMRLLVRLAEPARASAHKTVDPESSQSLIGVECDAIETNT